MRSIVLMLAVLLGLTACQTTSEVGKAEIANADYGTYPENVEEIVKDFMFTQLKDPFTAQYKFKGEPYKAYLRDAPIMGGKPIWFGYIQEVMINGKNSYGGYVGWKQYRIFIMNGEGVKEVRSHPWFSEKWYQ